MHKNKTRHARSTLHWEYVEDRTRKQTVSYPEVKLSLFPPYAITKKNWKIEHYKDILLSMNDNLIGFRTEKSCFILLSNTITFLR